MWQVVVAVVITLVIAIPVSALVAVSYRKKVVEAKLGNADEKAREIIDEALKTAEAKKRESLLEVKEESIRTKNELDKEIKDLDNITYEDFDSPSWAYKQAFKLGIKKGLTSLKKYVIIYT